MLYIGVSIIRLEENNIELCKRQGQVYIRDYKKKYELRSHMLYKDLRIREKVFAVYLYNYESRNIQMMDKRHRVSDWIYTEGCDIAKVLELSTKEYNRLLKEYGAKCYYDLGMCFDSSEECEVFIDMLYRSKLPIEVQEDI